MNLHDAQRGVEIVDARLTAIQSELSDLDAHENPEQVNDWLEDLADKLDKVIGDVRVIGSIIVLHKCPKTIHDIVDDLNRPS